MKTKNYYEVLGIRVTALNEEIELAYRGRRTQYHPDKYASTDEKTIAWATAEMQAVNEAYKVLSNAAARTEYDHEMVDSDSESETADGDFGSVDTHEESESLAQSSDIYRIKGLITSDRLDAFSAIQAPLIDSPESWKKPIATPAPLPPDIHDFVKRMKMKRVSGFVLLLFSALVLISFPLFYVAWVTLLGASLLILIAKPNEAVQLEKKRRSAIFEQIKSSYEKELTVWDEKASGKNVHAYRNHVINTTKQFISFVTDLEKRAKRAIENSLQNQIDEHLRSKRVRDCAIAGVGPSRKEVLIRHGIKSALDVKRNNFIGRDGYKIPGIGESVYNYMVTWKNSCVDEFEGDWAHPKLLEKLVSIYEEYAKKSAIFDSLQAEANQVLTQKITYMEAERVRLSAPMQMATNALTQAESDHKLLKTSHIGTVAVVVTWVFVCTVVAKPILENLDNSSQMSSRPSPEAISPAITQSNATALTDSLATTSPTVVLTSQDVDTTTKSLDSAKTELIETKVNVDSKVSSNAVAEGVLVKSESAPRPEEVVKQYAESQPKSVARAAPAPVPTPKLASTPGTESTINIKSQSEVQAPTSVRVKNGSYNGTISCSAVLYDASKKGYVDTLNLEINGETIYWLRRNRQIEEKGSALFKAGQFNLNAYGSWNEGSINTGDWQVVAHLVQDGTNIAGTASLISANGATKHRECTIKVPVELSMSTSKGKV